MLDTNVLSEFARPDNKPDQQITKQAPYSLRKTWLAKDLHAWFEGGSAGPLTTPCEPIASYELCRPNPPFAKSAKSGAPQPGRIEPG